VKAEIPASRKKNGTIIGPTGITLHGSQAATSVVIDTTKGDRISDRMKRFMCIYTYIYVYV
jgi:hypothetical protein